MKPRSALCVLNPFCTQQKEAAQSGKSLQTAAIRFQASQSGAKSGARSIKHLFHHHKARSVDLLAHPKVHNLHPIWFIGSKKIFGVYVQDIMQDLHPSIHPSTYPWLVYSGSRLRSVFQNSLFLCPFLKTTSLMQHSKNTVPDHQATLRKLVDPDSPRMSRAFSISGRISGTLLPYC